MFNYYKRIPHSSNFKYRDRTAIMLDIMSTIRKYPVGKKKTQIMVGAKLNYNQTEKYLNFLVSEGLVSLSDRRMYKLTNKGLDFLQIIEMQRKSLSF